MTGKGASRREILRDKGQFWTPAWVANAMVAWATAESGKIFDPAVGSGAFLRACKVVSKRTGRNIEFHGHELYPEEITKDLREDLSVDDFNGVVFEDFMTSAFQQHQAIVANPPYIRHHRLSEASKADLHDFAQKTLGLKIDGRAGLHIFFLIKALTLLAPGGGGLPSLFPPIPLKGSSLPAYGAGSARNSGLRGW